jgi:hypothetical protein
MKPEGKEVLTMPRKKKHSKHLENKIKELQEEIIDLEIEKHRKNYIHIPFSWPAIGRLAAFLGSAWLAILNFLLLIQVGRDYGVWTLFGSNNPELAYWTQLIVLWPLIGEYVLVSASVICLVAVIKGGFSNLKSIKEGALIFALICVLIGALIGVLIVALIGGLIGGLIVALIGALIFALIGGLIGALIFGLIGGLIEEFK